MHHSAFSTPPATRTRCDTPLAQHRDDRDAPEGGAGTAAPGRSEHDSNRPGPTVGGVWVIARFGPGQQELPAVTQVLVRREGVLGRLTLNRPEALNALDPAMIRALAAALAVWEHEDEVRAVLLDGDARIARYPKPYVALMDGLVMGAASGSPPTAASAWSPSGPRSSCPRPPSATCPTSAAPTCSPRHRGNWAPTRR
jgi:hypothetical protein